MTAPPRLFDRALIRQRLARATAGGAEAFLAEHAAREIVERLGLVLRDFPQAADLGGSHGALAAMLGAMGSVSHVVALDRVGGAAIADEDALPLKTGAFDLIASAWGLGFVNDLPGALAQIHRALKPDGLLMAVLPGSATLGELRAAFAAAEAEIAGGISPRVAPFADVREAGGLLQRAGFALPVADSETLTVRYDTAFDLMRDLRRMGATNALADRSRTPLRRDMLMRMAAIYAERFSDPDGRIRASFEMIFLSGWAPHESQQKPLKPGSARMRLADVLMPPAKRND